MYTQALSNVSTLGDLLENITFLGLGLLILIVALAICQFFVNSISKVFAETSDRIEGRSTGALSDGGAPAHANILTCVLSAEIPRPPMQCRQVVVNILPGRTGVDGSEDLLKGRTFV